MNHTHSYRQLSGKVVLYKSKHGVKPRTWKHSLSLLAEHSVRLLTAGLAGIHELEVLASLNGKHSLSLAFGAFKLQDDLLSSLGLLAEDGLGLSTETCLLTIVTSLTLSNKGSLTSFVLSHLHGGVLLAAFAMGIASLRNGHHLRKSI